MDGPGMSLFNGAGSIHLNTSAQRLEEEEAIEDQKRRNEELQNDLKNCFDDFIDDEDDSVNDSSHFISMNMPQSRSLPRSSGLQQKTFENSPLNLQAELMHSASSKGQPVEHMPNPSLNRVNADVGIDPSHQMNYGNHRMSQKELHNHNGYGNPHSNSPAYQSTPLVQEQHQDLRHLPLQGNSDFTPGNTRQNDDQLQIFYQMRVQEVQRLSEELAASRRDAAAAHDALYGRLAVAEAERERAQLSLHQSQELVANSKHRITELEHQASSLHGKLGALAARNEELNSEVTATTASLMDSQRRVQALKMNKDSAQSTDALFKAQQDRYREDTNQLEKDLMKTRNKLQDRESEVMLLESRYRDLERSKEELLVEKGSTINRLAMELEEAQNRVAASDTPELKERISQLIVERNTARMQIKDMAGKLEATATELVDFRTKYIRLQEEQSELEAALEQLSEGQESDSFAQLKSSKTGRGFSSQADKVALLRIELSKTIAAQKLKTEQIDKLNKTLHQKDQLIETLKDGESRLKRDIEHLKETEHKKSSELNSLRSQLDAQKSSSPPKHLLETLKSRCTDLEEDLNKTQTDLKSLLSKHSSLEAKYEEVNSQVSRTNSLENLANTEVVKERDRLAYQLKDAQKQIEEFKNLYVEVCGVKDKVSKELADFKSENIYQDLKKEQGRVEELRTLLEKEKAKVDEVSQHLLEQQVKQFDDHLKSYQQSMEAADKTSKEKYSLAEKNFEIANQFREENENLKRLSEEQKEQLTRLISELEESRIQIKKFNTEAELQGERDRLIADLKEKGKQFEAYIHSQQARLLNRRDASTSPSPNLANENISITINSKTNDTQHVNLRMEEIIREEIAQHFAKEINKAEGQFREKVAQIEEQYNNNVTQLTDVLKLKTREVASLQGVIERAKLKDVFFKLSEYEKLSIQNEQAQNEYKINVEKCQQHISKLKAEVEHLRAQKQAVTEAADLKDNFVGTLKEYDRLKEKYKVLKKTALKYKEYITEKDKHIESELKRIKTSYEESLRKMQQRLENVLKDTNEKPSAKLELESKYSEKILHNQNGKKQHIS